MVMTQRWSVLPSCLLLLLLAGLTVDKSSAHEAQKFPPGVPPKGVANDAGKDNSDESGLTFYYESSGSVVSNKQQAIGREAEKEDFLKRGGGRMSLFIFWRQ